MLNLAAVCHPTDTDDWDSDSDVMPALFNGSDHDNESEADTTKDEIYQYVMEWGAKTTGTILNQHVLVLLSLLDRRIPASGSASDFNHLATGASTSPEVPLQVDGHNVRETVVDIRFCGDNCWP